MRFAPHLLVSAIIGMTACHHSDNTPTPMPTTDPQVYIDSMAGNHHWHGIGYSYIGPPGDSAPIDSLAMSSDEILGVSNSNKRISLFDDSLDYLGVNSVAHTLVFAVYDWTTSTADTLVYNYNKKAYLFKRYELHQNHGILTVLQSP